MFIEIFELVTVEGLVKGCWGECALKNENGP